MRMFSGRDSPARHDCADLQVYRSVDEMQETSFPGTGVGSRKECLKKSGK
ncbi:uncharacterized protein METZ01_LOCUS511911, partial [marine metagenome]